MKILEDFSPEELDTKMKLQKVMMEIFGYVNEKKMPHKERAEGALQWALKEGGEDARMAKLFGDVCSRPEIKAKLSGGLNEGLIAKVKFEMEKILYPEIFQEERRRAA